MGFIQPNACRWFTAYMWLFLNGCSGAWGHSFKDLSAAMFHLMNPTRTLAKNWAQSYPIFLFFFCFSSFSNHMGRLWFSWIWYPEFLYPKGASQHILSQPISSLILSSCTSWLFFQLRCSTTQYLIGLHSLRFSALFHFDPVADLSKFLFVLLFYFPSPLALVAIKLLPISQSS